MDNIDKKILADMIQLWGEVKPYYPGGFCLDDFHKCQRWQRLAIANPNELAFMRKKSNE